MEQGFVLGSHNSATSGKLVWWQRAMAPIINLTSRCQDKSIEEQLRMGVRVFNLQVVDYRRKWYISHGTAIYNIKLFDVLKEIERYDRTYFQLVLDKNLLKGQNEKKFMELVKDLRKRYEFGSCKMLYAWIEGGNFIFYNETQINMEEKYWTKDQKFPGILDNVPLPRYYAKKYNDQYKATCQAPYLMLDFV